MVPQQYPPANLKARYRGYLELAAILVLALFILGFYAAPRLNTKSIAREEYIAPIENIDIPPETQQFEKPPAPVRPSIPIESESEEVDDEITIEEVDLASFKVITAPPPPPRNDMQFIPYDEPPEPIGGYLALQRNVKYPDIAREAEIQGRVIVKAKISKDGHVLKTLILQGLPGTGLDESAMDAVKKTRWKPAYQRDKPVTVWISVPVTFKLRSS